MNEPRPVKSNDGRDSRSVFISFASANRRKATDLSASLESRGVACWIACRDVAPGENYQDAIVHAIHSARAMVLVFSRAANNSDEIKKELSLASKYRVPVIAVRIENFEPTDALAYELSTRQWIDAFTHREAALDTLVTSLDQLGRGKRAGAAFRKPTTLSNRLKTSAALLLLLLLVLGVAASLLMRPHSALAHSMQVRLTGFARLSSDLPSNMPETTRDEMIAAFGTDGIVSISTAQAPPPGSGPAYALGGAIRRDGDTVRVMTRLMDERTGATLWSNNFTYQANEISKVPRHIAVDAGNVVRCGIFAASTYPHSLSDQVLSDYLQYCQDTNIDFDSDRALDFARKVVAQVPDFSWGWSAIEAAAIDASWKSRTGELRAEALTAADKAIALDPTNSEALAYKSELLDDGDLVEREKLLKRALLARPLACGCEHMVYGSMLQEVGRFKDAAAEFRRSTDVVALDAQSQFALADTLMALGEQDEGKLHIAAAMELATPEFQNDMIVLEAPVNGDYRAGLNVLSLPTYNPPQKSAFIRAYEAAATGNLAAKTRAAAQLAATPQGFNGRTISLMLGALGAYPQALKVVYNGVAARQPARIWLWFPSMRGALRDPSFPAFAERLGLMTYWRTTHTKPDVCLGKAPPPLCRSI